MESLTINQTIYVNKPSLTLFSGSLGLIAGSTVGSALMAAPTQSVSAEQCPWESPGSGTLILLVPSICAVNHRAPGQ